MRPPEHQDGPPDGEDRLFWLLQRLLQLPATELRAALDQCAELLGVLLHADKVDAWLRDPTIEVLRVAGVNDSPMSRLERQLGLDVLALADEGRVVEVYRTGVPYRTGRANQDPLVRLGFTEGLGVRSMMCVPFEVDGERRGVLLTSDADEDAFDDDDLHLLQAAAGWLGLVAHRAELVQEIARQSLEQGRRMAAEELVTVVAHDLRNLLTPIRARAQMIASRARRQNQETYASDAVHINAGVQRLDHLVGELLDVSRLDRGLLTLNLSETDLVALVRDAAERFSSDITPVVLETRAPDLSAEVDAERTRQLMDNLLSNAVKHSPAGAPVCIELSGGSLAGQDFAILAVSDSGPGIPEDIRPRLFTRFTWGGMGAGLGLGLYLTHAIVAAHGGTIEVDSQPGSGARFSVMLPLRRAPVPLSPPPP